MMSDICFRCNTPGHWARDCTAKGNCFSCKDFGVWSTKKTCSFCGEDGHVLKDCPIKEDIIIGYNDEENINLNIQDIMFNCSISCQKKVFDDMTRQVDKMVMQHCSYKGYIDEYKLADLMFVKFASTYTIFDKGHLQMLGYIIHKYISADNRILKEFLAKMIEEYKIQTCGLSFEDVAKFLFGLTVVHHQSGAISFRKRAGRTV